MMKHAAETRGKFGVLGKLAAALVIGFAAHAAQANDIIDFEGLPVSSFGASDGTPDGFVYNGDGFLQYGVSVAAFSNVSNPTSADFVGMVVNGSDVQNTCFNLGCPVNNASTFFGALNDGYVELGTTAPGQSLHVYGLDASFIGDYAGATYPAVAGLLRIQGMTATGTSTTLTFNLAGTTDGNFNFQHISTGAAFAAQDFVYVDIFGYVCNTSGSCQAFQTDEGQFALDNIDLGPSAVSAVPEASSWLMLSLGLAGITAAARRRNNATRNRA